MATRAVWLKPADGYANFGESLPSVVTIVCPYYLHRDYSCTMFCSLAIPDLLLELFMWLCEIPSGKALVSHEKCSTKIPNTHTPLNL